MIDRLYTWAKLIPSDINEHLGDLAWYSKQCGHITEMGVRGMVSTWAFLLGLKERGGGRYVGIDIVDPAQHGADTDVARVMCRKAGVDYEFRLEDTLKIEIEPTDFLFIDTLHTGEQLRKELELHAGKVQKFIGFHDTVSCKDELQPVIDEFLKSNPEWSVVLENKFNNGVTIIQKHG